MLERLYGKQLIPLAKNLERNPGRCDSLLHAAHGCAVLTHRFSHLLGRLDSELRTTLHCGRIADKVERMARMYLM